MHSTILRHSDFTIWENDQSVQFEQIFKDVSKRTRIGVVTPYRFAGVGASNLIMAFVTAFYDCYRADSDEFFAYPDYFTFQQQTPVAHYTMMDIWPPHRNVFVGANSADLVNAIIDRGIDVLLIPEGPRRSSHVLDRIQLPAVQRLISACYLYSPTNEVQTPTLAIETERQEIIDWTTAVFQTPALKDDPITQQAQVSWQSSVKRNPKLRQTFQKVSLDDALLYLT